MGGMTSKPAMETILSSLKHGVYSLPSSLSLFLDFTNYFDISCVCLSRNGKEGTPLSEFGKKEEGEEDGEGGEEGEEGGEEQECVIS